MLGKSKKIFLLFFVLFGLFFVARPTLAFWKELGTWIVTRPFLVLGWLLVKTTIWIAGLAGSLLNWVLSPDFIKLSYTNPARNPIIDTGLGITRGFVNMLLVLVLVYIAIATILRLAGYETKKLLITFILVALLVNFSPVICGLIVDASNIVMNFFVQDLKADAFGKSMGRKVADLSAGFNWETPLEDAWGRLVQLFIMSGFLLVLAFILLIFTVIFILRYLAIWLLVILSPLAFVCYILPITRKYWDIWWKQFIHWSFVGVTCGFYLYLGLLFVTYVPASITAPTTGEGGLFDNILPFFVSTVFLGLGVVFGLQSSAAGASAVISMAKRTQKASTKWVGKQAGKGIKQQIERFRTKEAALRITKAVERVPGARWFLPETFRKYGEARPAVDYEQGRLKPYSSREIAHRIATRSDIGIRAMGGMMELLDRGDMQDLVNAYKKKYHVKTDEELFKNKKFKKELERPIQIAFQSGYQSKLLRGDPRLARMSAGKKWAGPTYKGMTEEQAVKMRASEARRSHINNWEREVVEDKWVTDSLMERGREVFEAIDTQLKRGMKTTQKTIDTLFSEYIDDVLVKDKKSSSIAKGAKRKDEEATKKAWGKFREHFKKTHKNNEGYFLALGDERFVARGWREGSYLEEKERGIAQPSTPAGAAVEAGEGPPRPADTGEARRKKRKTPDVGKEE